MLDVDNLSRLSTTLGLSVIDSPRLSEFEKWCEENFKDKIDNELTNIYYENS